MADTTTTTTTPAEPALKDRLAAVITANATYVAESPSTKAKQQEFDELLEQTEALDKVIRAYGKLYDEALSRLSELADDLDIDLELPVARSAETPKNAPKDAKKGSRWNAGLDILIPERKH